MKKTWLIFEGKEETSIYKDLLQKQINNLEVVETDGTNVNEIIKIASKVNLEEDSIYAVVDNDDAGKRIKKYLELFNTKVMFVSDLTDRVVTDFEQMHINDKVLPKDVRNLFNEWKQDDRSVVYKYFEELREAPDFEEEITMEERYQYIGEMKNLLHKAVKHKGLLKLVERHITWLQDNITEKKLDHNYHYRRAELHKLKTKKKIFFEIFGNNYNSVMFVKWNLHKISDMGRVENTEFFIRLVKEIKK